MRTTKATKPFLAGVLGVWIATLAAPAAEKLFELDNYFHVDPDKVVLFKEGNGVPLEKEVLLANGATLHTNGTLKLPGGMEKQLAPGKDLTLDGLYMAADGRFLPVIDHYMIDGGKTTLVQDGQSRPVEGVVTLRDGSKIMPTGWLARPDGTRRRLLDGQRIDLDGKAVPSEDFVVNKDGKIFLQKDGALLTLEGNRVMAMSDGTRVRADGQITRADGTKLTLQKGWRLSLPGAR